MQTKVPLLLTLIILSRINEGKPEKKGLHLIQTQLLSIKGITSIVTYDSFLAFITTDNNSLWKDSVPNKPSQIQFNPC